MEYTEFYGTMEHETDKAYLVFDGRSKIWIPKSQIKESRNIKDDDWEFVIPLWLAIDKGIV